VATTTLDELIERTRLKANVLGSNFVLDPEIITYLNEALRQFRELVVSADDSYYQATLDFSISAQPGNEQVLPDDFWQMRGLDAFAGDLLRQTEIYAREFRNRFDSGVGYGFGGTGNSLVVLGYNAEQCNPFRLTYTPKPQPLAEPVAGKTRTILHNAGDGTNAGKQIIFINGAFTAAALGGTLTLENGSGIDGVYTILKVVNLTTVEVKPEPTPSVTLDPATIATLACSSTVTRSFAVAPADNFQPATGIWTLQNGQFGADDIGGFLTADVTNNTYDGVFEIIDVTSATVMRVPSSSLSTSPSLTGTAIISRQATGTRTALDQTEDNFSEYFSVRAAMVIARKKRQDTLVAQLAAERGAIEERISALSTMRQSEPKQAPVLWGRRRRPFAFEDWDI
jgi:hypothetical protein